MKYLLYHRKYNWNLDEQWWIKSKSDQVPIQLVVAKGRELNLHWTRENYKILQPK